MPAPVAHPAAAIWLGAVAFLLAAGYVVYAVHRRRTELERTAAVAIAGETRFRALLEAAPDATITVGEDGRITLINSETEELFGYGRDELIGQPVEVLLPETLREAHVTHRRDFHTQPRRRPMGAGLDLVARRKDGTCFPTEISLSPLHTDEGVAVIVVVRDITARKQAEVERAALLREQAARSEAEAASRAKDDFVAVVSHELRTPLNAILGWASLLRSRSPEPDVAAHALAAIERNAQAQRQLIDDLLDVSRMVTGKIALDVQDVDVARVVGAAVETVRPAVEKKRLRLQVTMAPGLPPILGDAGRLQQILWNLLTNAVKFTPEDGWIRVTAQAYAGEEVRIEVSDSGVGIDPAFLPHAFDRFRQHDGSSTRAYGGLGLGLAIVRELVELHGGRISAESAGPGRGAVFTVTLPAPAVLRHQARRIDKRAALASAHESELPDLHGVRILVVDDDAETRELLKTVLTGAGAEVAMAASGDEALTDLTRQSPDVLLSDIGMPQIDGYELVRRVRLQRPTLPSIALTAYGSIEDRERAEAAGYEKHLTKPVLPRDLLAVVATVARQSHGK